MSEGEPENERDRDSLFVLGEGVIELVAVVVEPRVVGILRLTPRAPHGDTPAKEAGDRGDSAASLIGHPGRSRRARDDDPRSATFTPTPNTGSGRGSPGSASPRAAVTRLPRPHSGSLRVAADRAPPSRSAASSPDPSTAASTRTAHSASAAWVASSWESTTARSDSSMECPRRRHSPTSPRVPFQNACGPPDGEPWGRVEGHQPSGAVAFGATPDAYAGLSWRRGVAEEDRHDGRDVPGDGRGTSGRGGVSPLGRAEPDGVPRCAAR